MTVRNLKDFATILNDFLIRSQRLGRLSPCMALISALEHDRTNAIAIAAVRVFSERVNLCCGISSTLCAGQSPELLLVQQRDAMSLSTESPYLHQLQTRVLAGRLQRVRTPAHDDIRFR